MSEREHLQLAVRRWRRRDQSWQTRFGRFVWIEAALTAKTRAELRRLCQCGSHGQARKEMADILKDELERIARASACHRILK